MGREHQIKKCEDCEYEVCSSAIGMGLPMCHHPDIMRYHRHGKFSGHYGPGNPPKWCPLQKAGQNKEGEDIMENTAVKEKRIHRAILNIPISQLRPHPNNPRKDIGDVEELAKSIKINGLMQNLTVVPTYNDKPVTPGSDFTVLIGHRRLAASKLAGLTELPCKIIEGLTEREQLSTMLEENMQRTDLTIYEQAEGFQMMLDLGETMDTIVEKTGFSERTIQHRLNIAKLDRKKLKEAEDSFQISIKDLILLEGVKEIKERNRILSECRDHKDFEWKVRNSIRDEKRDEAEKELAKLLEKYNVKKAPKDFPLYGSDIVTVKEFDLDLKLPKKSFKWDREPKEGAELLYCRAYGSTLKVVYKGKPQKAKKTSEELKRDEIEKNKKKIKGILKGFATDRRNFIMDVVSGKYSEKVDSGKIMKDCYDLLLKLCSSISYNELAGYLTNKNYWDLSDEERQEMKKHAENLSMEHSLLMLADTRIGADTVTVSYDGTFEEKDGGYSSSVVHLRKLIKILEEYGFQMNNPEVIAILDGTSELYKKAE